MCPEMMDIKPYNCKCDMWALGCMIHELMALERPFSGVCPFALFDNIKHVRPPQVSSKTYSYELRVAATWLLQKDPQYRPDAFQLYSHFLRNWAYKALKSADGVAHVRQESIPWKEEDLMDDENKMEVVGNISLGMTLEKRQQQRDVEDKQFQAEKSISDKQHKKPLLSQDLNRRIERRELSIYHSVLKVIAFSADAAF